jgi:trans-aconitate 2-methyltransferase
MPTEWNAAAYRDASALQEWLAGKSLAAVALAGDERVLDVGCGDGRLTAAIAARLPRGRAVGCDASRQMIEFAAQAFAAAAHPNLCFAVADAARLPWRAAFDCVVSFNALHWVLDLDAGLAGITAALVPGGRALLRFVPAAPRRSLEDVIEDTCGAPAWAAAFADWRAPFVHPDADDYAARAARAGLAVERVSVVQEAWDFASRAAFHAFAEATFVAWTNRLPAARRAAFIDEVLDRYAAVTPAAPAPHAFVFAQLEIALRR